MHFNSPNGLVCRDNRKHGVFYENSADFPMERSLGSARLAFRAQRGPLRKIPGRQSLCICNHQVSYGGVIRVHRIFCQMTRFKGSIVDLWIYGFVWTCATSTHKSTAQSSVSIWVESVTSSWIISSSNIIYILCHGVSKYDSHCDMIYIYI